MRRRFDPNDFDIKEIVILAVQKALLPNNTYIIKTVRTKEDALVYIKERGIKNFIDNQFSWNRSTEGFLYWSDVSRHIGGTYTERGER